VTFVTALVNPIDEICLLQKKSIRYCCGKGGGRSVDGSKLLKEYGLNAIWLCGGTDKWLNSI
jgi:rhodanese-related sulfurtransferase